MSEPKFTPGPWSIQETTVYALNNERNPVNRFTASIDSGWISGNQRISRAEVWANARLIAVAPDMFTALTAAVAFIDSHIADPDLNSEMVEAYSAYLACDAKSVIAKATASPMGKE